MALPFQINNAPETSGFPCKLRGVTTGEELDGEEERGDGGGGEVEGR